MTRTLSFAANRKAPEYYPAFDYLRISLASIVVVWHSGLEIWRAADYAVQIFFALSGWLIGGILLRSTPSKLPRFYFHRAARIWIPFFVAIGLLALASLLKGPATATLAKMFFYDATFTFNFFGVPLVETYAASEIPLGNTGIHFWSICAEEQFYLFAPFLITLLPGGVGRKPFFWLFISIVAISCPYWKNFGAISVGVLAAVTTYEFGEWHAVKKIKIGLAVVFALVLGATYFELIPYRIGAPISAIALVLSCAWRGKPSRLGVFLGGISYPMYLNHWIGWFIANALFAKIGLRGTIYNTMASLAFATIIAAVAYICVDRVVKNHRDKYFTPARGKATALCGFTLLIIGMLFALRDV